MQSSGGPGIHVVLGDLASVPADAVLQLADAARFPMLGAGGAVVTGGGAGGGTAPFVIHVVIQDERWSPNRDVVRRALVAAWQRAKDWQLTTIAAPLIGSGPGPLSTEEAAGLLIETYAGARGADATGELHIVVEHEQERELVEAIIRRTA